MFQQTRMKDILRRIIYVNGKWIYYYNLKYSKSWPTITKPSQQSTLRSDRICTFLHQRMDDEMLYNWIASEFYKIHQLLIIKSDDEKVACICSAK